MFSSPAQFSSGCCVVQALFVSVQASNLFLNIFWGHFALIQIGQSKCILSKLTEVKVSNIGITCEGRIINEALSCSSPQTSMHSRVKIMKRWRENFMIICILDLSINSLHLRNTASLK